MAIGVLLSVYSTAARWPAPSFCGLYGSGNAELVSGEISTIREE